jgi:hypothetical protein
MESSRKKAQATAENRRRWEKPELKTVGLIGSVLQVGMGKLSPPFNDPGEPLKPPGMGG